MHVLIVPTTSRLELQREFTLCINYDNVLKSNLTSRKCLWLFMNEPGPTEDQVKKERDNEEDSMWVYQGFGVNHQSHFLQSVSLFINNIWQSISMLSVIYKAGMIYPKSHNTRFLINHIL